MSTLTEYVTLTCDKTSLVANAKLKDSNVKQTKTNIHTRSYSVINITQNAKISSEWLARLLG